MGLLAGTADGLYRLTDGAPERLADGDVAALAVDGTTVWAVVDATALMCGGADGGFAFVTAHDRSLRSLLPTAHGLLAGTAEAGLTRLQADRLVPVEGFGAVAGRDDWYTPWGGPADTRSLATGPDGTLYANVHVGGIVRSSDDGAAWEPTIDVDADVHQVTVAGEFVLAASARGLAVSDDRGTSWCWRTEGLHARYARAVAVVGGTVLVSVSQGPGGGRSAVYCGPLGTDGSLTRCRQGCPSGSLATSTPAASSPTAGRWRPPTRAPCTAPGTRVGPGGWLPQTSRPCAVSHRSASLPGRVARSRIERRVAAPRLELLEQARD